MKAADKAKALVLREYPKAESVNFGVGWIFINKDRELFLGAYSIIGRGKTEANAWKSAARRVMKDNG